MLPDSLILCLVALSSCRLAAASPLQKQAFTVRSVPRSRSFDGPGALRKAYLKHRIEVPETLKKRQLPPSAPSPEAQPTGLVGTEIAVSEKNDVEYLSPVDVGGSTLELDFDTGSSDLWVFTDRLNGQQRRDHAFYALSNSTGQLMDGLSWRISYGDGSGASGVVYADRVTIGGVTATQQAVEAATSVSPEFISENSDGLLGLGFGTTNTVKPVKQKTWFENIKSSLKQPLFTVSLKKNATGVYDFGYIDEKKYVGPIQYVPINTSRGYWEYTATGFQIGNSAMIPHAFQSIADTGTTLMLLPAAAVTAYYAQVPGAQNNNTEGGYVFPCSSPLPDLTVQIAGNVSLQIPGTFVNRSVSMTPGSTACYGGIQKGSETLSIWGDVFLKSQFAVFDGNDAAPRIGFARQSGGNPSAPPTGSGSQSSAAPPSPSPIFMSPVSAPKSEGAGAGAGGVLINVPEQVDPTTPDGSVIVTLPPSPAPASIPAPNLVPWPTPGVPPPGAPGYVPSKAHVNMLDKMLDMVRRLGVVDVTGDGVIARNDRVRRRWDARSVA